MERNIAVEKITQTPTAKREVEIVERKGIGHPDSVSDGIAESVSRALSKYYIKEYGRILHHNTDQVEVVGGQSAPSFGGGKVLEPTYILLSGRATTKVGNERIPFKSIAIKATREFLKSNFSHLDLDADVMIDCRIGQGSIDLVELYDPKKLRANDTSFGVGYAPYTDTERLVLSTEQYLNGPELKKKLPAIGYDIKVMGFRQKDTINLTVAAAYVDRYVRDDPEYFSIKEELRELIKKNAEKVTDKPVKVFINTADEEDGKGTGHYLTVTGLSMENGDDGSVGRGNRVTGLITPYRPMSMEAAAGKNPVTHVGKLYNVFSLRLAQEIVKEHGGDIEEVHVRTVSQIGRRIDDPHVVSIQIMYADGVNHSKISSNVRGIADNHLERISELTNLFVEGKVMVY
ncbi:MAG TPA: methionine adenosyltransferase [Thermoplasmataceae archaeon]|nr:methionine adenosyltransferase [Thermoplasmatales archaeon AK]HLH85315.1 methionine adenosyltransferase [Thermoplasmataceae archaeon]